MPEADFSELLEEYREVDYYLTFLDGLDAAGTQPEVAYDSASIRFALVQLSVLLPDLKASDLRDRASRTIEKLSGLSADADLRAECQVALGSLNGTRVEALEGSARRKRCGDPSLAFPNIASACSTPLGRAGAPLGDLKVDGLGHDLLANALEERDPDSGKSRLPWLSRIFVEQGAVYENFYTRGISLSAPSWSMLDTGRHTVIRGNVEYDRFTGEVYDYLNFFPLYIGYARQKQVDSPGVEVLDRAGIPLLIDRFQFPQIFQSFQLFQRGVRWTTLQDVLKRKFSSKSIFSMLEGATPSYDSLLQAQTKAELEDNLQKPQILYLDFFTGRRRPYRTRHQRTSGAAEGIAPVRYVGRATLDRHSKEPFGKSNCVCDGIGPRDE